MKITYFGTGAALNPSVDTMHMLLEDDVIQLYIDAGGGMSLMQRVLRQEVARPEHIWITHCHSDHLLGIVHLLRIHKAGVLTIYCSHEMIQKIEQLMILVGQSKLYKKQVDERLITYVPIDEAKQIFLGEWIIEPINIYSSKTEQYGFIVYYDHKKLVFFGDEAIGVLSRNDLDRFDHCDRLLCEAFCTEQYKEERKPHEKNHITAMETGEIGTKLHAHNLIISHIDNHLLDRENQLDDIKREANSLFEGNIYVPKDNQIINL